MLSKRVIAAQRSRMQEGKGWGKAPLRYTFNHNVRRYEVDEAYAWVIPVIDQMVLVEELGMMAIADRLNDFSKSKMEKQWYSTKVRRLLLNKAYHGVMEKKFKNGETISLGNVFSELRREETWRRIHDQFSRTRTFASICVTSN